MGLQERRQVQRKQLQERSQTHGNLRLVVSSGRNKANLLDGSLSTYWQSDGSTASESSPHWVEVTTSDDSPIGALKVYCAVHGGDGSYCPEHVRVKTRRRDSDSWSTKKSKVNLGKSDGWVEVLSTKEAGDARSVRLEVTKNHNGGCDCRIASLEVSGRNSGPYGSSAGKPTRPTLGDCVEICDGPLKYVGLCGKIVQDDRDSKPFKVELKDGSKTPFLQESSVRKISRADMERKQGEESTTIRVGDRVRVKRSVSEPRYGWGEVKHEHVGTVTSVESDGDCKIKFRVHSSWNGVLSELEKVTGDDDDGDDDDGTVSDLSD